MLFMMLLVVMRSEPVRGPWRSDAHVLWPPEPPSEKRRDGRHHQRSHDEGVEQQTQTDRRADLTDHRQFTDCHGHHREGEHQARRCHHRPGTAHGTDDAGVEARVYLLLEARHQQQVVVGAHRKQDDHGHRHHHPVQLDAQQVLPDEH
jgi:hypothetical protein